MLKLNLRYIGALILILSIVSCRPLVEEEYILKATGDSIIFPLNPTTTVLIRSLFPYEDKDGNEYLTFQNEVEPEILVYDMNTQEYVKTITLEKEGANGVGLFCGYYIQSWDEIYIPCRMKNEIDVVNSNGEISKRLPYSKTIQGKTTIPSAAYTRIPICFIGQNMYINQEPNRRLRDRMVEDSPVTLMLDTITMQLNESSLRFPPVMSSEKLSGNTLGVEFTYSRCYNGNSFLYSFFFDEDISVVSPTGKLERKVKVKSRYLDRIYSDNRSPSGMDDLAKILCEIPFYGSMIYDKYRDVYYRFVYPETEVSLTDKCVDIWLLGRSRFSIIVLNKDLEVIGETLFPENVYASKLFFVRKDGLYLSTSFVKNPSFSDDELTFKRIDLVKKSKE